MAATATATPATTTMRSLSMPENLCDLAEEIRDLQERMEALRSDEDGGMKGDHDEACAVLAKAKRTVERSRSFFSGSLLGDEEEKQLELEELLRSLDQGGGSRSEEDEGGFRQDIADQTREAEPPKRRSFLPKYNNYSPSAAFRCVEDETEEDSSSSDADWISGCSNHRTSSIASIMMVLDDSSDEDDRESAARRGGGRKKATAGRSDYQYHDDCCRYDRELRSRRGRQQCSLRGNVFHNSASAAPSSAAVERRCHVAGQGPESADEVKDTDAAAATAAACVSELLSILGGAGDVAGAVSVSSPDAPSSSEEVPGARSEDETCGGSPSSVMDSRVAQQQRQPTQKASSTADAMKPGPPTHDVDEEGGRHFTKTMTHADRADSMPPEAMVAAPPSPCLPRKPSLKRVSSLSSTHSSSSSSNLMKRNVSFSRLEIREYDIAISDHPSCSYGPPIQLGWQYRDRKAVGLEEYEKKREPRRNMNQLVLSYNVRRYLLLKRAGYSKGEIQQAMDEVERVKRERLITDMLLPTSKIDEVVEEIFDSVKGIFLRRRRRRH